MECEEPSGAAAPAPPLPPGRGRVMRLFDMAQIAAAGIVDMRNALPLLQFAHFAQAKLLQNICIQVRPRHAVATHARPFACPPCVNPPHQRGCARRGHMCDAAV